MITMKTRACQHCGAIIGFIRTPSGRWMVVEPLRLTGEEIDKKVDRLVSEDGRVLMNPDRMDEGYRSHWARCPGADEARRRRAQ